MAELDIVVVGGGNTAHLLALWRTHGLDVILRDAWRRGLVLSGVSAGMMCWFRGGLTDSFGGYEPLDDGLGLIDGLACPHYDGEAPRKPAFRKLIAERAMRGFAADDGAALHFAGSQFVEVVSSRPSAAAYSLAYVDGQVVETRLPTRYLGASA